MITEETKECLGKCPYCGSKNIDYESSITQDNTIRYPAICDDCGGEFSEEYSIEYAETVYVPKEDWKNDNDKTDWNSGNEPRG